MNQATALKRIFDTSPKTDAQRMMDAFIASAKEIADKTKVSEKRQIIGLSITIDSDTINFDKMEVLYSRVNGDKQHKVLKIMTSCYDIPEEYYEEYHLEEELSSTLTCALFTFTEALKMEGFKPEFYFTTRNKKIYSLSKILVYF